MKRYLIYLSALIFFCSCNEKKEKVFQKEETTSKIAVVITENPKVKSKISFSNGISMPAITYLEFNTLPDSISKFEIGNEKSDTFKIKMQSSFIEVSHRYNTLHLVKYYLKAGDTLLINYSDSIPKAHLLNSKASEFDINYDTRLNEMLYSTQITPDFKTAFPLPFMDRSQDLREESERVKNQAKIDFSMGMESELIILDSLKKYKLINSQNYKHRTVNNFFNSLAFNLKYDISNENLPEPQSIELMRGDNVDYDKIVYESADSLLSYYSFVDFVEAYLDHKYKDKVPILKGKNSFLKDYRLNFDFILTDTILTRAKKEHFLYKNMEKIAENFTINDRENYVKKFEAFDPEPALLSKIKKDFGLDATSEDLELKDMDGEIITLEKLKSNSRGKILYIDFWASWCKPCIELMPNSHLLRDSLADHDIKFLYFSIDEDEKKWKQASQKHKINVNNYLVKNRYSSLYLEEIKLDAIPRYLLFDKEGNLIQDNAPDPSASELRKTIFRYLKKTE